MVEKFKYSEEDEREEDVCYDQDVVLYYEEGHGKYADIVANGEVVDGQEKLETFLDKYPLWSIKDWSCIPFLDGKESPDFFDHPEVFEVVDENIKYNNDSGMIEQDEDTIHTHTVVCLHVYPSEEINELREDIIDWASKYSDISRVSIIPEGSWYSEECSLVIIEQRQKHPTVSIYNYYEPVETFLY